MPGRTISTSSALFAVALYSQAMTTTWEAVLAILGLGAITWLTRAFFLMPRRELPMPGWLSQAGFMC